MNYRDTDCTGDKLKLADQIIWEVQCIKMELATAQLQVTALLRERADLVKQLKEVRQALTNVASVAA